MSLKTFHLIFISLSIVLSAGYGAWAVAFYLREGDQTFLVMGALSFIVAVFLVVYEIKFKLI